MAKKKVTIDSVGYFGKTLGIVKPKTAEDNKKEDPAEVENKATQESKNVGQLTQESMRDAILQTLPPETRKAIQENEHLNRYKNNGKRGGGKRSEGYTRCCMVVNEKRYAKLRYIALTEGLQIRELMDQVFDMAIESYEKQHGVIPEILDKITSEKRLQANTEINKVFKH